MTIITLLPHILTLIWWRESRANSKHPVNKYTSWWWNLGQRFWEPFPNCRLPERQICKDKRCKSSMNYIFSLKYLYTFYRQCLKAINWHVWLSYKMYIVCTSTCITMEKKIYLLTICNYIYIFMYVHTFMIVCKY